MTQTAARKPTKRKNPQTSISVRQVDMDRIKKANAEYPTLRMNVLVALMLDTWLGLPTAKRDEIVLRGPRA